MRPFGFESNNRSEPRVGMMRNAVRTDRGPTKKIIESLTVEQDDPILPLVK